MIRTYDRKLIKGEKTVGILRGDHLRVLRTITRRRVTMFSFTPLRLKDIENKLDKVTSKSRLKTYLSM